jgi:hypothetical protein
MLPAVMVAHEDATPGRYVIGCEPWAGLGVDEVGRYAAMRATLMVEPVAS